LALETDFLATDFFAGDLEGVFFFGAALALPLLGSSSFFSSACSYFLTAALGAALTAALGAAFGSSFLAAFLESTAFFDSDAPLEITSFIF
jgi:hypothetical protein